MKALLLSLLLSPLFVSSAFAQTSATFAEAPDALLQLLPIVIIFILFYFLLIRPQQKKKRKPLLTAGGYRGRNMKAQQNETTRIAIAAAIIQGSAYRRRILRKLKTRYRAYAPEIGIDASRLLSVCTNMERRKLGYEIVYMILILIAILSLVLDTYSIFLVSLALTVPVAIYKAYKDEFVIAKRLSASRFSEALFEKEFPRLDAPKLDEVAFDSMNVFVYKGFSPFYFSGQIVSRVSFVVDVTRKTEEWHEAETKKFVLSEIYKFVTTAVSQIYAKSGFHVKDALFISGQDVSTMPDILPKRYGRPLHRIDDNQMASWMDASDSRARYYKWISIYDWGGDLIISYFIRFTRDGGSLCTEITACILTPPGDRYRVVDAMAKYDAGELVRHFALVAISAPARALWSTVLLCDRLREALTGGEDARLRKEILLDRHYDYGAEPSVRVEMASGAYANYFQLMDSELYEKSLNRCIFDAVIDFLAAHGIDVSALKESRTTIINSGILVKGGDVKAEVVAVGEGATAKKTSEPA